MARRTLIQQSRGISSKQKARYHELEGAGKRRVKRPFFGLNASDEAALYARVQAGVDALLNKSR